MKMRHHVAGSINLPAPFRSTSQRYPEKWVTFSFMIIDGESLLAEPVCEGWPHKEVC
jgi:hypothetical protein